jgi:hypothetical protein
MHQSDEAAPIDAITEFLSPNSLIAIKNSFNPDLPN